MSGVAPEHVRDVVLADADLALGPVEHQRDHARLAAHQLERLEPELRVLQREGVEHADDDEVGGGVDRRDHLGREPGRRVDDDDVERRPQRRVDVADQLDRDRARLVGPGRGEQHADARRVGHQVARRASGRRACRRRARGRRTCARGRARGTARRRRTGGRGRRSRRAGPPRASATPRLALTSVLPEPPFGPSTQTSRPWCPGAPSPCRLLRATSFWIEKRTWSGVCGSIRMSSAPASKHAADEAARRLPGRARAPAGRDPA